MKQDLFDYVKDCCDSARAGMGPWESKQLKFHRMRMRIKKTKTFPFVGCSNIRMPTAEIKIRKLKAALLNTVFGIRPVVQVVPPPSGSLETAMKIEKFLDWLIMDVIKLKNKAIIIIDQALEIGFYLAKPFWRVEINRRKETWNIEDIDVKQVEVLYDPKTPRDMLVEFFMTQFDVDKSPLVIQENLSSVESAIDKMLSGETKFEFYIEDVLYNKPDVGLRAPERVLVPNGSGFDPQGCSYISDTFFLTLDELKARAKEKKWDLKSIKDIESYKDIDERTLKDVEKDMYEGITRLKESNKVKICEWFGWYDLDKDGVSEKVVITIADDFGVVLKQQGLPLDNGKFPFVKFFYELRDDRWFAHRGIPELAEDIIKEIDTQHNMKIDQQTIRNAPMFLYRAGMVNPNLVQMIPNQGIPVNGLSPLTDTVSILNMHNSNIEFSYEREQMLLESKVEELIGQIDFTLQSMINKRQPRTLGEVEMQQQNMQQVFSLDAGMMIEQFSELFSFIWDLWCQYGDDETEFAYFGENGWEQIRLSKEEIQGKYKIVVRGNDQNTNPSVKIQKAQQILAAVTNPLLVQTGVVTPVQIANGLKRFYQAMDIAGWEELINFNIQPPSMPQPPPVGALIKPRFEDLTHGEQAQVLQSVGIQPDVPGRELSHKDERLTQAADLLNSMKQITNVGGNGPEAMGG